MSVPTLVRHKRLMNLGLAEAVQPSPYEKIAAMLL
jgi:hypothetical protein